MTPPRRAGARSLALGAILASGCTLDAIGAFEASDTTEGVGAAAAAGGGGAGAGGTGATGVTSSGSGGADRPPELNCTNGLDDDADGAVDCDDDECGAAGFRCFEAVPGALGYGYLSDDGSCAEAWNLEPMGDCSTGCSCSSIDGVCEVLFDSFSGPGCVTYLGSATGTGCANVLDGYRSFKAIGETRIGAGCAPSPGPNFAPSAVTLCRVELDSVGTCETSSACLPPAAAAQLCVVVPASTACGTSFVERGVFAGPGAPCRCDCDRGPPSCVGAKVDTYRWSDLCNASNSDVDIPADGQCHDAGEVWSLSLSQYPEKATCSPRSEPAALDTSVRLCCEPPSNGERFGWLRRGSNPDAPRGSGF